ncbi:hypothetical protein Psta_3441 [Pirellula staleyi DSM 6068]|uniref:Uncharacterized protein n=1 Tax=Pirellula staleyi (strain ATCC 27377 / DSM 6068 / ICPB 4128) TaxID=530564 RepID=D2QY27_PIRSD|nr:hypothetical protein Psta_3441 [Pirellula staleyi DSM 6068]
MGNEGSNGKIKGFNAISWKFNMQNHFGWKEKREETVKVRKDGATALASHLLTGDTPNAGDDSESDTGTEAGSSEANA